MVTDEQVRRLFAMKNKVKYPKGSPSASILKNIGEMNCW